MELESHFEFIDDLTIRIAGTRVGIETVVRDYQDGASPEEIALRYPTLSLLQVHATITYYLAHQQELDAYLNRILQRQEADWQEQQLHPTPLIRSLRERLAKHQALPGPVHSSVIRPSEKLLHTHQPLRQRAFLSQDVD